MTDTERVQHLLAAIQRHHDQQADDRCWLDDWELYLAAGLEPADLTLPPKVQFLSNCSRYYDNRGTPGDWPSYQHLEAEVRRYQKLAGWLPTSALLGLIVGILFSWLMLALR